MDFETYAKIKSMNGVVAENWKKNFQVHINSNFGTNRDIKILDFGCGDGKYFNFFSNYFQKRNIYGVEVSKTRIERSKKNGWGNAILINEMQRLPFENNFFDFVNSDQVIEHIKCNEIDFYLKEIKRVLKPGGFIFFVTPNYPIKRVYDFIWAIKKKDFKKIKDDPTHFCKYNFLKMRKIFKNYFVDIKLIPTGGIFFKLFRVNSFSHKIFLIAKK